MAALFSARAAFSCSRTATSRFCSAALAWASVFRRTAGWPKTARRNPLRASVKAARAAVELQSIGCFGFIIGDCRLTALEICFEALLFFQEVAQRILTK